MVSLPGWSYRAAANYACTSIVMIKTAFKNSLDEYGRYLHAVAEVMYHDGYNNIKPSCGYLGAR